MHQEHIRVYDNTAHDFISCDYPDVIFTEGVGPCTAIALYNTINKKGYLLHLANLDGKNLEKYLLKIENDFSNFRVYVVGCADFSDETEEIKEIYQRDRASIELIIKKYFKRSKYRIKWSRENCTVGYLGLDTLTGKFIVA